MGSVKQKRKSCGAGVIEHGEREEHNMVGSVKGREKNIDHFPFY